MLRSPFISVLFRRIIDFRVLVCLFGAKVKITSWKNVSAPRNIPAVKECFFLPKERLPRTCLFAPAKSGAAHTLLWFSQYPGLSFTSLCFEVGYCMVMSLKQKKITFKPRIKLIEPQHIYVTVFWCNIQNTQNRIWTTNLLNYEIWTALLISHVNNGGSSD